MMDDLISRAAAIAQIKENYCDWCDHTDLCKSCETYDCIATIEQQVPAVDAVPVVHAHWIETTIPANTTGYGGVGQEKKEGILCSECRCAFDISLLWANDYCPHCGAKMDGESK